MNKKISLVLALLLTAVAVRAATTNVLTVAIFDFEARDTAVRSLGQQVSTLLNASLSTLPQIITVERTELDKALGETELSLSGVVSPDSATKVGQLTGAQVLVTGRVFKVENQTVIVAKVIGTETSRVYGAMVQGPPTVSIVDLSSNLAAKLAAVISDKGDTLTAKVQTQEERVAKIKQAIDGRKLPVVAVKINERHYGARIIDPATETELSVTLQRCGFTVVDAGSTRKPEVEISGDAFSAFGTQKGNLISCKSRVELKVRNIATGDILLVDRQTSTGVDVAEQTAAKTALDNATDTLAERILPKLAQ